MSDLAKQTAAHAALAEVKPGMTIGLGTGSTAQHFVEEIGRLVRDGFRCRCVPTSLATQTQARALGIPLVTLEDVDVLDLTVDGADELDRDLTLIKGGGGALLREKIVAAASRRMVVIADASKLVTTLGKFPLPIEVNEFGLGATRRALAAIAAEFHAEGGLDLRKGEGGVPFRTDGGHLIVDASFGRISDAKALSAALLNVPGVVQHGLFIDICATAYVADGSEVKKLDA